MSSLISLFLSFILSIQLLTPRVSCQTSNYTFTAHSSTITGIAFTTNGYLVSSGLDNKIRIWNATNWASYKNISVTGYTYCLTAMTSGRFLTGHINGPIYLFSASSGTNTTGFYDDLSDILSLAVSSKQIIASAQANNLINLWNTSSTNELKSLSGHTGMVYDVSFISDSLLASGSADNTVRLWNISTGTLFKTLSSHTNDVYNVEYLTSSGKLASSSADKTIKIWDLSTYQLVKTFTSTSYVFALVELSNGYLASCSYDNYISVWNLTSYSLVRQWKATNGCVYLAFSSTYGLVSAGSTSLTVWASSLWSS